MIVVVSSMVVITANAVVNVVAVTAATSVGLISSLRICDGFERHFSDYV